jgi:hypothetical protein
MSSLPAQQADRVWKAIGQLEARGPTLGRPRVDSIKGSRLHNMKELRAGKGLRVLFAFDRSGEAVLLHGGDKDGQWNRWYPGAIRAAERTFAEDQRQSGRSARWREATHERGAPSGTRSR